MRSRTGCARAALLLLLALPLAGCSAWKRFAYEGFDRDSWQKPDQVIELLAIGEGDRLADLGAGSGYFTFRLAAAVGESGRVYAVDVDEDMLDYLEQQVAERGAGNVEVVRGAFHDPNLPDGQIDLLFTSNTYHHIEDRSAYFGGVRKDLSARGRVAILELNDVSWFPRTFGHMTPKESIVSEMEAAGYRLVDDFDLVERQHFLVFVPAS
jgi:ubiquinone/menaquinone biosynthesis C-methylase UbiE